MLEVVIDTRAASGAFYTPPLRRRTPFFLIGQDTREVSLGSGGGDNVDPFNGAGLVQSTSTLPGLSEEMSAPDQHAGEAEGEGEAVAAAKVTLGWRAIPLGVSPVNDVDMGGMDIDMWARAPEQMRGWYRNGWLAMAHFGATSRR